MASHGPFVVAVAVIGAALLASSPGLAGPDGIDGAGGTEGPLVAVAVSGTAPVEVRAAVDDSVRTALQGVAGVRVQPLEETRSVLGLLQGMGVGCQVSVEVGAARCALSIGGLAGVDVMVVGDSEQIDDVVVLRLGAFDVVRQRALGTPQMVRLEPAVAPSEGPPSKAPAKAKASSVVVPLGVVQQRQIALAIVRLLAPEQERGQLAVTVEAGTAIVVDRVPRGIAPRGPIALPPGPHELWLGRAGRISRTETVEVTFNETTRVEATLDPDPDDSATPGPLKLPEPTAASAPSVRRIAVYDIEAATLPPHLPALAQSALTIELRKLEGVVVVSMDEIRALIDHEANRQVAACSDDTGCLAGIADALGADTIITVQLAAIEGQSVYGARRIDTASFTAATTVQERLKPDEGREFIAVTGRVVQQLFPELPLRAGARRGASPELVLRANPPPLSPVVSLGLAGVATAGALTAAVSGAINLATIEALRTEDDGAARKAGIASLPMSATGFWLGVGVTTVGIASAGVTALFTDWEATP